MTATPTGKRTTIFSPRNLINTGIFTVLFILSAMMCSFLGVGGPVLMFVGYFLALVCGAIVMMLFIAKSPYFGAMTMVYFFFGLMFTATGRVWYAVIGCTFFGLAADAIAWLGRYRSRLYNSLAYGVGSLYMFVLWSPLLFNRVAYMKTIEKQMGEEWVERAGSLLSTEVIGSFCIIFALVGIPVAWWAQGILAKHFVRAGLVTTVPDHAQKEAKQ